MMRVFRMPKLGVNMTEATISEWLVGEGDTVLDGQVVLLAETDKAVQEIPIGESGKIARLLVHDDDQVDCQQPILLLQDPDESFSTADIDQFITSLEKGESAGANPGKGKQSSADTASEPMRDVGAAADGDTVRISPLAKKTAQDLNIDYRLVPPSRSGARISADDVLRYAETHQKQAPGGQT